MKCIVLAAGKGTRMLPLTKDKPKHLIEVAGKPFLLHFLNRLKKAGYSEKNIGIIVCYKGEMIREFLEKEGFRGTVIDQKEPLGTGHAVLAAKEFVKNGNFVVINGDSLFPSADLENIRKDDEYCYLTADPSDTPEKYGVVIEENGMLHEILEKPDNPPGDLINSGLYKLTPDIFFILENIPKSSRGEIELTDAVMVMAKEDKVKVLKGRGFIDFGCREDIVKIGNFLSGSRKDW